jgi:hypothetical protein
MNRDEIIDLLSVAAAYDQRTVGNADIAAWTLALGDLDFGRARDAVVAHYREQTRRIMPADIRQHARAATRQPVPFGELPAADGQPPNEDYLKARDQAIEAARLRHERAMAPAPDPGDRATAWINAHTGPLGAHAGPPIDVPPADRWCELPYDPPELRRSLAAKRRAAELVPAGTPPPEPVGADAEPGDMYGPPQ